MQGMEAKCRGWKLQVGLEPDCVGPCYTSTEADVFLIPFAFTLGCILLQQGASYAGPTPAWQTRLRPGLREKVASI